MNNPENQETFDDFFSIDGMSLDEQFAKTEAVLIDLRECAAKTAAQWLAERCYFNGDIASYVDHAEGKQLRCYVVLTDYGLPLRMEPGHV